MIPRLLAAALLIVVASAASFWFLTMPRTLAESDLPAHTPDLANGERMFWAGGCDSCHAAAEASGDDLFRLGGGAALVSDFGTFYAPNISPDPDHGIGRWSTLDFVNAMKFGVAPGGVHLYPAFPYTSYQRMRIEDIIDLKTFLDTLPAVAKPAVPTRWDSRSTSATVSGSGSAATSTGARSDPALSEVANRGAYLVQGPGHCGECHTPAASTAGRSPRARLRAARRRKDQGTIPNITRTRAASGPGAGRHRRLPPDGLHAGVRFGGRFDGRRGTQPGEAAGRGRRGDCGVPEGDPAAPLVLDRLPVARFLGAENGVDHAHLPDSVLDAELELLLALDRASERLDQELVLIRLGQLDRLGRLVRILPPIIKEDLRIAHPVAR